MSDPPKKSGSMFEKLGQRITTLKEDITDNIEQRRKQLYNNPTPKNDQVHFFPRLNQSEESLVIERKAAPPPPPPSESRQRHLSGDEGSIHERLKQSTSDSTLTSISYSQSSQDLFSCETNEQVKEMIMNNIRQEINRCRNRAFSESSGDENIIQKIEHSTPKSKTLLTGPRFRSHTIESNVDLKHDLIYPVSFAIGLLSIIIILWKPISPFLSGYFLGFVCANALAYVIIRIYLMNKVNENIAYESIDFPDLDMNWNEQDKHICCEIVFARYDPDRDEEFVRYPAVIRLEENRLIIQLPIKGKTEKELKFIGFREYLLANKTKILLVPEHTLTRVKYWLNEYPIVLENLQISDKQMIIKDNIGKTKFDIEEFFNNSQTNISLFFETCPDKEDWFHRLSTIISKQKTKTNSNSQLTKVHSAENLTDISENDILRSQINETDISQARFGAQELLNNEQDQTSRSSSLKKKTKKLEDHLERLLKSTDCLDEAAITLNFLTRRLFCDVFQEPLFKDLLKEKFELKLKEIAVSVLEDLHVESIDMGNTYPVILKIEPMQWNSKGLWFKLFLYYRGSFKITIKTRIFLQKLLNCNPINEQSMFYQNHSEQITHKEDERIENEKISTTKEPELLENVAARKIGNLLTRVAANKHFQRFAALKPVAGVFEKLSNAEIGANIELINLSGMMTINIPPPPSDRIWIGFSEMPELNLKVTPVFGESQYSYALIHDFLEARIRDEIKRLLVFPSMDDQLLPFFRDWVLAILEDTTI